MSLTEQEQYEEFVTDLVAEGKPRLFAVLREFGVHQDAEVAAWGMAWDGHVELVSRGGASRMSSESAERALRLFGGGGEDVSARLVWVDSTSAS
ncbi:MULTISPECIES: hypothetical protein [Saccharothrix]|uniref:hypothetical protein n=1 Tax=Saccharothrix TaxID=2071 RepID=UPI00093B3B61|nr:hypothetical protein [Saccharothrix sp. CB00851]